MLKLIQKTSFFCFALIALLLAAIGVAPAEAAGEPAGLSAGTTVVRIGLLYIAFLCVLLAVDLTPQKAEGEAA